MAAIKKRIKNKGNMAVWGRTLLLILLALTIVFPLYMTVIIAFKQPTEMTNDVSGALALPKHFSFQNFIQAIQTTDFFHTIGNSLFITIVTLIVVVIFHSMAAYAIGRKMNKHKSFNFLYLYFISGMFVPFSMLMLPLVKETSIIGIDNKLGLIILYTVFFFPMNLLLYTISVGRSGLCRWGNDLDNILESNLSIIKTDACDSDRFNSIECLE